MSGESSNTNAPLPFSTVLHMKTIKLSSSNYLLWNKQMLPLLAYQQLTGYVDGSIPKPSATITNGDNTSPNPAYASWIAADQPSLSEEAMAETLGHSTSHAVRSALVDIYQHDSLEPESHEMFLQSITDSSVAPVAFNTTYRASTTDSSRGRGSTCGRSSTRGSSNRGRGRGNRRPPHCQLCRTEGHYANQCPDLHTFARSPSTDMLLLSTYCDDYPMPSHSPEPSPMSHPDPTPPCELCTDPPPLAPPVAASTLNDQPPPSPTQNDQPPPSPLPPPVTSSQGSGHPMITRSKNGA
ncbi:zinc finger, CCHC-type, Gag-polypeptide of LTR copia-type [Artemisia annua]|uniref:Zinc finger, CCHC-type, Gag-polypeptide of LTR copia-type n=1 Tax=Artemisia annua TaxID=35608 RepID=A0A2U1N361_ARTAN|nr:zinc finger, CCHC-type, Gag-polypeptide of LTR copia-type [Artemisia annua]